MSKPYRVVEDRESIVILGPQGQIDALSFDRTDQAITVASALNAAVDYGKGSRQRIETPCPSCGSTGTLFIGGGGYLTCSVLNRCEQPSMDGAIQDLRDAVGDALVTLVAIAAQPATAGRLWGENPTLGATLVRLRKALRQPEVADPLKRMS